MPGEEVIVKDDSEREVVSYLATVAWIVRERLSERYC